MSGSSKMPIAVDRPLSVSEPLSAVLSPLCCDHFVLRSIHGCISGLPGSTAALAKELS